jgi:WD40 repeat protein
VRVVRGHRNEIRELVFSRDGLRLASASLDRTVRLWDVATSESLYAWHSQGDSVEFYRALPIGKGLVIGVGNEVTGIPDVLEKTPHVAYKGHTAAIAALALSPDGTRMACAGAHSENKIRLWIPGSPTPTAVRSGH